MKVQPPPMTAALVALMACGVLGAACSSDHILWIGTFHDEAHLQLVENEPDPF